MVILSDWIASSAELFPYEPVPSSTRRIGADNLRLEAAWRGLDLPGPWVPDEPQETAAELFASRFVLPPGAEIRPVQAEAVRMAREMPGSGLLIIEAPMGEGKTEAALAAAEILAARTRAGGCLVALPTRATGDAMFSRLLDWLEHLPSAEGRSVFLAHAKAALNDEWSGLVRAGSRPITAVDSDGAQSVPSPGSATRRSPSGLQAHQWLRGRKKGLLASFTVGTIDQVLFGGLKSRRSRTATPGIGREGRRHRRSPCVRRLHEQLSRTRSGVARDLQSTRHSAVRHIARRSQTCAYRGVRRCGRRRRDGPCGGRVPSPHCGGSGRRTSHRAAPCRLRSWYGHRPGASERRSRVADGPARKGAGRMGAVPSSCAIRSTGSWRLRSGCGNASVRTGSPWPTPGLLRLTAQPRTKTCSAGSGGMASGRPALMWWSPARWSSSHSISTSISW